MILPRSLLLAVAALVGSPALAAATDCDGDIARTLHPAVHEPADARAYWLDAGHLKWPGETGAGRYRLYHSAQASLRVVRGARVAGADGHVDAGIPGGLPAAAATRFDFTGDGVELALVDAQTVDIRELLRGQVVLVREDQQGRVLDATYLQHPGALDALYANADQAVLGAPLPCACMPTARARPAKRFRCIGMRPAASGRGRCRATCAAVTTRIWWTCSCPASASSATASPIRIRSA